MTPKKPVSVQDKTEEDATTRWLRVSQAVALTGLSRSRLFLLFDSKGGPVRTKYLMQKNAQRGIRLISEISLRKYLAKFDTYGLKGKEIAKV